MLGLLCYSVSMKRKTTFKDMVKNLPKPKTIQDNTKLPGVFDMFWDAKLGKDLKFVPIKDIKLLQQTLVENGYDAKEFFGKIYYIDSENNK